MLTRSWHRRSPPCSSSSRGDHRCGASRTAHRLNPKVELLDPPCSVECLEVLARRPSRPRIDLHDRPRAPRRRTTAGLLADRLCLSAEEQTGSTTRISAFIHDVGKVGVPTELLLAKPGPLDDQERDDRSAKHSGGGQRGWSKPLAIPRIEVSSRGAAPPRALGRAPATPTGWPGEDIPLAARDRRSWRTSYDAMNERSPPYRSAAQAAAGGDRRDPTLRRFAQFDAGSRQGVSRDPGEPLVCDVELRSVAGRRDRRVLRRLNLSAFRPHRRWPG